MATAKLEGVEASAISLLKRAVEMDNERQFSQALTCYQEGIQLLLDVLKGKHLHADCVPQINSH